MLSNLFIETLFLFILLFLGIFSEPHCSKFHYEEKILEKMIRLEFMVKDMKKEIENINNKAMTTLGNLESERRKWENALMTMKDTSLQNLNNAIQEMKNDVQNELNKLTNAKDALTKEVTESLKRPEVVFSARSPRETSLTSGQTMVFTEIILNKGDAYNKEDGVFTVPFSGIYMFTVQWCKQSKKGFYFDFVANDVPFKMSFAHRSVGSVCDSFDALTAVNKGDSVRIKIKSPYSGKVLDESPKYYWNTFSGVCIQTSQGVDK